MVLNRSSNFTQFPPKLDSERSLKRSISTLVRMQQDVTRVCRLLNNEQFRQQTILRLQRHVLELQSLTQGKLVFDSTETWRSVYEEVLSSCVLKRYLSVALIHTEDYWRGAPGDRSIEFNVQLVADGFYVHRILIIDDFLWPPAASLPSRGLHDWILNQAKNDIQVELVRLSELEPERDLAVDFGIYGDTAVGYQITDELGQTVRYEMLFGAEHVRLAEDRWKRLALYAQPLQSI